MLHTKFRENGQLVLDRRFLKGFTIYGRGGHLGHVTQMSRKKLSFPPTQGGSTQNLTLIGQAVLEKKMFEIVYDDDGRRTMGIL